MLFLSSQMHTILRFFLSRNLKVAQSRAWELTLKSRGKNEDFWQPYVEGVWGDPLVMAWPD